MLSKFLKMSKFVQLFATDSLADKVEKLQGGPRKSTQKPCGRPKKHTLKVRGCWPCPSPTGTTPRASRPSPKSSATLSILPPN